MAWTDIPDTDIDVGSPLTTALMTAFRDNIIAAMDGDPGAPGLTYQALKEVAAGSTIIHRETTAKSTGSTSYQTAASFVVIQDGTLRITLDHRQLTLTADAAQARIRVNGSVEVTWSTTNITWTSRSQDITISAGDEIDIQYRMATTVSGSPTAQIRNVATQTDGEFLWLPQGQTGYTFDEVFP